MLETGKESRRSSLSQMWILSIDDSDKRVSCYSDEPCGSFDRRSTLRFQGGKRVVEHRTLD
jgi:hypothetical protein